ncbi:MAG TPA: hypothetical protein VMI75_36775 [Polyangiaceae bacterium]|nr:hypothetical protein [Polyangiaceae bacterium]
MRASHGLWLLAAAFAVAACSSCSSSSSGNGGSSSSSSGGGSGGSSGGGSGSSSGGVDAGPSATQACDDFATAFCSQLSKCTPFAFQTTYGDMTTCTTRAAIPCPNALAASGTKTTPSDLEQCVAAINAETCDEALDNPQPSACSIPGTVAAGAACGSDWQCTTGFCQLTAGTLCGTCATRAMPGQTGPDGGPVCLVDAQCAATSICAGGKCATPGMSGATCSNTAPCLRTLACIGGTCKTPLAAGATCAAATDCDGSKGLYCDSKTKTCTQTGTAAVGGMCGVVNGVLVACTGAAACANISMQGEGTCHQAATDGAPCGTGVSCQAPAVCIKSTSFACEVPNAGNCH